MLLKCLMHWFEKPIATQNTRIVIVSAEYNTFWVEDIDKVGQRYPQEYPRSVKSRLCSFITISRQLYYFVGRRFLDAHFETIGV